MRRSLKGILTRIDQLAQRVQAAAPGVDIAAILIQGRKRSVERERIFAERGYGETAAERYARHLEQKPSYSAEDTSQISGVPRWFPERQLAVWTRLEPEYAAEAAREAVGFPPSQDPAWWSKTDQELRESARGSDYEALLVADSLVKMRCARIALLEARNLLAMGKE